MTLQEMKDRKRELGLSNEELARLSGVPFSTVQKIFSGVTTSPRFNTIQAIEKVLAPSAGTAYSWDIGTGVTNKISEAAAAYGTHKQKKQGEYTLDDYYALPDERRVELIDGEIFDMAAPSLAHQIILGQLHLQFQACVAAHGADCTVFLAPCDVQLDNDEKTMVQPDLFVKCGKVDKTRRCFPGAPDLTVEILSDSTRSKDLLLKTYKYKNAGVREYWIIDPKKKEVLVYDFSDEDLVPEKYPFTAEVPINISEGRCSVDFAQISKSLE